jgi:hypothetical protein
MLEIQPVAAMSMQEPHRGCDASKKPDKTYVHTRQGSGWRGLSAGCDPQGRLNISTKKERNPVKLCIEGSMNRETRQANHPNLLAKILIGVISLIASFLT